MNYGGEVSAIEKINRLESYLSDGLPRYQDVLEQQNRKCQKHQKELNIEIRV